MKVRVAQMSSLREILQKEGTGYTRNKKINRTENTAGKNIVSGKNQLNQSQKKNLPILKKLFQKLKKILIEIEYWWRTEDTDEFMD